MEQLKELPENWGILGCNELEGYLATLPTDSFYEHERLYGSFVSSVYVIKEGKWTEMGNNPKYFTEGFKVITFQQWDSIVNKKKEYPVANAIHESVNKAIEVAKPIKKPKLKVGDKIPEYLNGKIRLFCGVYAPENALYVDDISAGRYYISDHTDADQLAGDDCNQFIQLEISEVDALIEEHEREEKVNLLNNHGNVIKLEDLVNKKPNNLDMAFAEAVSNPYRNTPFADYTNPNKKEDVKEWIPQNGEEVDHFNESKKSWLPSFFVGNSKDPNFKYLIEYFDKDGDCVTDGANQLRKPLEITTKTHSEIAQLLGISKEQLKIVEG